jgi:anti-sigma factor RsiW
MHPNRLTQLLAAYVDGELTERQEKAVLRVIKDSAEGRALLQQLQKDAEGLRGLSRMVLSPDFSNRVMAAIPLRLSSPKRLRIPKAPVSTWIGLGAAAAVLFAISVGSYFYFKPDPAGPSGAALALVLPEEEKTAAEAKPLMTAAAPPIEQPRPAVEISKKKAPAKTSELLVKENTPKSSSIPSVPQNKDNLLGSELKEEFELPFVMVKEEVALRLQPGDLGKDKLRRDLEEELRKRSTYHVEIHSQDTVMALERLALACKSQGIDLLLDDRAQRMRTLHLPTDYALYIENVTPEKVFSVLEQMSKSEKGAGNRPAKVSVKSIVINGMSPENHNRLRRLLGTDPTRQTPRKSNPSMASEDSVSLTKKTENQVTKLLQKRKILAQLDEPMAIVVENKRFSSTKSAEVKQFLSARQKPRDGTIQVLLVLRGS